jgi:hypothetical protein
MVGIKFAQTVVDRQIYTDGRGPSIGSLVRIRETGFCALYGRTKSTNLLVASL